MTVIVSVMNIHFFTKRKIRLNAFHDILHILFFVYSTFTWRVGPWSDCSVTCDGGYMWRAVICIEMFANNTEIEVTGTLCAHPRPPNRRSCNTLVCPTWQAGEWSPVSRRQKF